MAFGLSSLLEAALLVLNAICVLHEERFLVRSSLLTSNPAVLNTVRSVKMVMRIPLVLINSLVITKKLLLG